MALKIDSSIRAKWYGGKLRGVEAIIFHYTANGGTTATARGNANYFARGEEKASAHFVVDTGDVVFQCVPLDRAAFAVGDGMMGEYGGRIGNMNSVSIEMVSCSNENGYYIPEKTMDNAAELYRILKKQYPNAIPLRHYDISLKLCPMPLVDAAKWEAFKQRLEDNMTGKEIYDKLNEYLKDLDAPAWAQEELEQAKALGITDGSKPMAMIPRYQAAIMCKRAVEAAKK